MVHNPRIATVIGGSGFLGTYVVRQLLRNGYTVRVLCRDPENAGDLPTLGNVGELSIDYGDLAKPATFERKIAGSHVVINLVGILLEKGGQKFTKLHAQGAEKLAQLAAAHGVARFVHVSALGVDKASKSRYARTKLLGEKAVLAAFPSATVLRPSVVFGREDNFFNKFAAMARILPFLPVIGGGRTKFQPVYVDDVASAIMAVLKREDTQGKIYELGGPEVLSFRRIIDFVLETTGRRNGVIDLPFVVADAMGSVMEWLPKPPMTHDQVRLLRYDNVVSDGMPGFSELGIYPTSIELIVPDYLERFRVRAVPA